MKIVSKLLVDEIGSMSSFSITKTTNPKWKNNNRPNLENPGELILSTGINLENYVLIRLIIYEK